MSLDTRSELAPVVPLPESVARDGIGSPLAPCTVKDTPLNDVTLPATSIT